MYLLIIHNTVQTLVFSPSSSIFSLSVTVLSMLCIHVISFASDSAHSGTDNILNKPLKKLHHTISMTLQCMGNYGWSLQHSSRITLSLSLSLPVRAVCVQELSSLFKVRKVKCTLVQALRLCTGRTAHRGSRGIALPFLDHGTRRGWGGSFTSRPLFTLGKDSVLIVQEAGWAPGPVWTGAENLAPHRDLMPRPSSP